MSSKYFGTESYKQGTNYLTFGKKYKFLGQGSNEPKLSGTFGNFICNTALAEHCMMCLNKVARLLFT